MVCQRSRAGAHDHARRGRSAGRHGAVRREVRRRRADGRDRRRQLLARAVRRHPRALDRGDRRLQSPRSSSAANVRRIEAVTGPGGGRLLRATTTLLREAAAALRTQPERLPEAVAARCAPRRGRRREAGAAPRRRDAGVSCRRARRRSTARVCWPRWSRRRAKALSTSPTGSRASSATPPRSCSARAVRRPGAPRRRGRRPRSSSAACKAGEVVKAAAAVDGRRGRRARHDGAGRRPRSRQAPGGDRRPRARRSRPRSGKPRARARARPRHCPLRRRGLGPDRHARDAARAVVRPDRARACARRRARARGAGQRMVVGLPLGLGGGDTPDARDARASPTRLAPRSTSPSSSTTSASPRAIAARPRRAAERGLRAAAVLLEGWLARHAREGDRLMPLFRRGDQSARAAPPTARPRA